MSGYYGDDYLDWVEEDSGSKRLARTRARVVERQATGRIVQPLPARFESTVVGVSFVPAYPENLHKLLEVAAIRLWVEGVEPEPIPAVLIRHPANEYDPNATEVHVPSLGEDGHLGHLPRAVAARLAPELDAGARWRSWVTQVRVDPQHPDRPGIDLRLERVRLRPV